MCVSVCVLQQKQETIGIGCDVIRVEIHENLTKEHLLETFVNCGRLFSTV